MKETLKNKCKKISNKKDLEERPEREGCSVFQRVKYFVTIKGLGERILSNSGRSKPSD